MTTRLAEPRHPWGELGVDPWVRRFAWATLVANIGIVLTGGAVRLTGSGLGCPTWPRCTDRGFTPHGALNLHSAIEFGNRTLTFLLTAIAVATFVSVLRSERHDLRRLALALALSVPAQAVLGGITVLTDLNPWVVSVHFLFSMAIVSTAVLFLWRLDHPHRVPAPARLTDLVSRATYAAAVVVLALGTIVTGSGPHAGDVKAPRNGLDPLLLSHLHADVVFVLIALTVVLVLRAPGLPAYALLGVELAQGVVGFVQYYNGLPVAVVELHLLGAALLAASVTWAVLHARETPTR